MNYPHKLLMLVVALAALAPLAASAQNTTTFNGNGSGGFGGPIGQGSLVFSSDGTTITGTITIGGNLAFNDDLVIYIDAKAGGYGDTNSFTDRGTINSSGNGTDELREATSGLSSSGPTRAGLTFGSGFGADYALALSPFRASFGSFYTLGSTSSFTYGSDGTNGNANLTPTGTNNGNGTYTYTFSFSEALIGNATSFNFLTTYLNGGDAYRSNETFGNSITDTGNPTGDPAASNGSAMYNLGSSSGLLDGIQSFSTVPEPGTWLAGGLLVVAAGWTVSRSRRSVA